MLPRSDGHQGETAVIKLLKRFLLARPMLSLDHPIFGRLTLRIGKLGPYWMHEAYSNHELTITIRTVGVEPPSEAQVSFFKEVTGDWDAMFQRVSVEVIAKYQSYVRKPFPERWQSALHPGGIAVPIAGNVADPWNVTFVCTTGNLGYLFNCWFENDKLEAVTVDT
jgi:hypothetical protein